MVQRQRNISTIVLALGAAAALALPGHAQATPIQAGNQFSVTVSGENTLCSLDPTAVGTFQSSGTLSVSNVIGNLFDATVVFGITTISLSAVTIAEDGSFSGSNETFSRIGVTGNHNLNGILSSTGISSSGTFQETTGPDLCSGTFSVVGGNVGQAVTSNSPSTAFLQQDQVFQGRHTAGEISQAIASRFGARGSRAGRGNAFNLTPGEGRLGFDARKGLSAGEMLGYPMGIWVSADYIDSSNDFAATAFESERFSALLGVDVSPSDNTIVGVAVGGESADVETAFNRGEADVDGLTVAAYAGFGHGNFSADVAAGYTSVRTEQFRLVPGTSLRVTSNPDGRRWFVSGNAHYSQPFGPLLLTGSAGAIHTEARTEAFTESNGVTVGTFDSELGQLRISAELAYTRASWEPFVRATLEHDYNTTDVVVAGAAKPDVDDTGGQLGIGLRYFAAKGFSASFEANTLVGRGDFDETSLSGTVRMEF